MKYLSAALGVKPRRVAPLAGAWIEIKIHP